MKIEIKGKCYIVESKIPDLLIWKCSDLEVDSLFENCTIEPCGEFDISYFLARYLCGNGNLICLKHVTRKQLYLISSGIGYSNPIAMKLKTQIDKYWSVHRSISHINIIDKKVLCISNDLLVPNNSCTGTYKSNINWLGKTTINKSEHVFPSPELLPKLMDNWFDFINNFKLPDDIREIRAYSQLLLIHPFDEGNGRLSRCILGANLKKRLNLDINPALYRLISGTGRYKKSAIEAIFSFEAYDIAMLEKYWLDADYWIRKFIQHINSELKSAKHDISNAISINAISHNSITLIDYLWLQPILSLSKVIDKFGWTTQKASMVIANLCRLSILKRRTTHAVEGIIVYECEIILTAMANIDDWLVHSINTESE